MTLYDENWNPLNADEIDLFEGAIEEQCREIRHVFVVDVAGEFHEEVVREYPETGGKDVEIVWDVEEQGHWETYVAETGELLDTYDNSCCKECGFDKNLVIQDVEYADVYRPFTPEELEEHKNRREQAKLEQQQKLENEQLVEAMPDLLCAMYEENLQLKSTIDQQEEVLCAMYEELTQVKDDSAIAYAEATRPY